MVKISWGRKLGFSWGVLAGINLACGGFYHWSCFLLAIIPTAGMLLMASNDAAADGKSISYGLND